MEAPSQSEVDHYLALESKIPQSGAIPIGELLKLPDDPRIKVDKHFVGLFFRYPYFIEMSRISTPVSLLWWIHHLTGKNWITRDTIHVLIKKVCAVKGWKMYVPDE